MLAVRLKRGLHCRMNWNRVCDMTLDLASLGHEKRRFDLVMACIASESLISTCNWQSFC